jgi:hypothetical protein
MLSAVEIEERMPVWQAFSELFRDTEMSECDWTTLIDTLRASGLPEETLKHILESEVAPAFYPNLVDIAGNWTGWTSESVRSIMLATLQDAKTFPPGFWLRRLLSKRYAHFEWERIKPLLISAQG